MRHNISKWAFLTIILVTLLISGKMSFAESNVPSMILPPENIDQADYQFFPYQSDRLVINLKARLLDYGYYNNFVVEDTSVLSSTVYDDFAMAAVEECCQANGLESSQYGLLVETYGVIMSGSIKNLNPSPTDQAEFHHILWGESSEAVGAIQVKLVNLGYMDNYEMDGATGMTYYGPATRDALNDFLSNNNLSNYNQSTAGDGEYEGKGGITPEVQSFILKTDNNLRPKPTPEPTPQITPEPTPTVHPNWFMRKATIVGIETTHLLICIIIVAIVGLIALVVLLFFNPFVKESEDENGNRNSVILQSVRFSISYKGKVEDYSCIITKILRIGRNVGSFPLNLEDQYISKRHCELYYLKNQLMLRDYSANGTIVNSQKIHNAECKLNSGDRIQIGSHFIVISF